MKRRSFIQKTSLLSSVAILAGTDTLFANANKTNKIDLSSFLNKGKLLNLTGKVICAETQQALDAKISIKTGYGLFAKYKTLEVKSENFHIVEKLDLHDAKKIKVKVEAEGYKTFEGPLYVNSQGFSIHTDMWKYNPKFKSENVPANQVLSTEIKSAFNFELVKA